MSWLHDQCVKAATCNFLIGTKLVLQNESPSIKYSAVFEDDGDTGHFYAWDISTEKLAIVCAMHLYDVETVIDRAEPVTVEILWSRDGRKAVLLIEEYPEAIIDFAAKRGYCRSGFSAHAGEWSADSCGWAEEALELFR